MRLILDENISRTVLATLRERGHDVLSVKESLRGQADEAILARAQSELRLVVTLDKDFGELAVHRVLPAECGILLFRLDGVTQETMNARILAVIESRSDWSGQFAVATHDRVRVRALPRTPRTPK